MISISDLYCALKVLREAQFSYPLWNEARMHDEPEEAGIVRVAKWQDGLERELVTTVAAACRRLFPES